jgi:hypothetical protein
MTEFGDATTTGFYSVPLPGGGAFHTRLELDEREAAAVGAAFERVVEQVRAADIEGAITREQATFYLEGALAALGQGGELLAVLEEFDTGDAIEGAGVIEDELA